MVCYCGGIGLRQLIIPDPLVNRVIAGISSLFVSRVLGIPYIFQVLVCTFSDYMECQ